MKIRFKKDKNHEINVFQIVNEEEKEFDYIEMIKALIKHDKLEPPDLLEGFTEAEIKSINSMVNYINKEVKTND